MREYQKEPKLHDAKIASTEKDTKVTSTESVTNTDSLSYPKTIAHGVERETVIKLRITYREQEPFWTHKKRPNEILERELEDLLKADRVEVLDQKRYEVRLI